MSMAGIIFFCFIIVSYFTGIWVGMQISSPRVTVNNKRTNGKGRNLQNKMGLPPRRR